MSTTHSRSRLAARKLLLVPVLVAALYVTILDAAAAPTYDGSQGGVSAKPYSGGGGNPFAGQQSRGRRIR